MNFDELSEIIKSQTGVSICPVCGVPYKPYHSRQMTCGTEECKKAHRATYLRERKERLRKENYELWCEKRREAEKKQRKKKKELMTAEENLKRAQDYWERREAQNYLAVSDGKEYAERQRAKTLAAVPKIDVSGFERRDK